MSSIRCGVGFSGNFLLEAPPPSPWKRTPGGGELGGRGGAGSGRGGARILQVLSGRLGPAQARPSLPQGRGESGGTGANVGPVRLCYRLLIRRKVALRPSSASYFLLPVLLLSWSGAETCVRSIRRSASSLSSRCPARLVARGLSSGSGHKLSGLS